MKKFTALVKDCKTNKELILSECSYNQACAYLESRVDIMKVKPLGDLIGLYCGRWFYYDEARSVLLGD